MKDLLNDVINDLADGHIDKAEAKKRVERIVQACEKRQDYWGLPPAPEPVPRDAWWQPPPRPFEIWCEDTGTAFAPFIGTPATSGAQVQFI